MFTPDSRYLNQPTYAVTLPDGTQVTAVVPPLPNPRAAGRLLPAAGQERLDLVAVQYLNAPTGFWRLCDSNNSMVAGALAARALIGIPEGGPHVSVTVQLDGGRHPGARRVLRRDHAAGDRGELRPARRAAAAAAGEPDLAGGPPVRRRRHLRADDERHPDRHPGSAGRQAQCIFDGYVLSWRLHLDRASTSSTIDIWAQDASWLMNIDDNVTEWSGQTDGEVANAIFASYGFTPAAGNTDNDSPSHTPDGHTLLPARHGPAVPARPGAARREALPGRLHGHPGRADRVLRDPRRRRPARRDDLAAGPGQLDGRDPRLRLGRHAPDRGGREPGRPHPVLATPAPT